MCRVLGVWQYFGVQSRVERGEIGYWRSGGRGRRAAVAIIIGKTKNIGFRNDLWRLCGEGGKNEMCGKIHTHYNNSPFEHALIDVQTVNYICKDKVPILVREDQICSMSTTFRYSTSFRGSAVLRRIMTGSSVVTWTANSWTVLKFW